MAAIQRNQLLLESRRKQEAKYRQMDSAIARDRQIIQIAAFETGTTSKINKRLKQDRYNQLKQQQDDLLSERRKELAQLFNNEMNNWEQQVLSKIETPEDRKQRIRERAYALKEAREKTRQEFVDEKYKQQWREANDDARTLDTKVLTLYMNEERLKQIEEKKRLKQKLTLEEQGQYLEWQKLLEEVEEKDRRKVESMRQADIRTKEGLKLQIQENLMRKQDHYLQTKAEDDEEIRAINAAIEQEEERQHQLREEAKRRGQEILRTNETHKRLLLEDKLLDQEHDNLLLAHAVKREKEAILSEEMKKKASIEASVRYKKYLEEQMKKEAIDNAYVDKVRQEEEERVWVARDNALAIREVARKQLMGMVDKGRQEQILERQKAAQSEEAEGREFAARFLEEARQGVIQENMERERRKQIAVENSRRLKEQMQELESRREGIKQEVYLEDKQMQFIEKNHRQRLAEQGGVLRLNRPLKQGQWYT